MRVGTQDILLPTMMVGNYPKPRWYAGQGYATVPVGNFVPDAVSFEAFEDCLASIVRDQERSGLDVIADGRVLGGDSPYGQIVYYFTERLKGYEPYGPPIQLPIYSTLYSPTVDGPVSRRTPMLVNQLRSLKKLTDKPVKLQYPGISALTMGSTNRYYDDIKELSFAIARAYNEEFKEVADAGADLIQMDEFAWHYGLTLGEWEADVYNAAVDGVDAQIITHVCWGNYLGTKGYLPSGPIHGESADKEGTTYVLSLRDKDAATPRAKAVMPRAKRCNMHILNYEIGRTGAGDLVPLGKAGWDRDFVAGVVDVRTVEIETATEVAERIRACLEYVPAERLGVTTDCGLINLPRIVAEGKLRALVEGAKIVRGEIAAGAVETRVPEEVSVG
ncbi:MAG: cobalamin-independent methionine synthase II family protein [Acidimicrobiia bacterium]